jgi:phosphatidylinositol alpha-mannosyltransferase
MNIGIVTQSYYPRPGGVAEVVHHTASILAQRGHRVKIITTNYGAQSQPAPNVIRIGRNLLIPNNGAWANVTVGIGLTAQLEEIFEREGFEIIQTHCPLTPTLPLLTFNAARKGQKIVGTFHAAAESHLAYRIFRRPLRSRVDRLDARIAVSEAAKKFARRYFPGSYDIVPNGIDCDRFQPGLPAIEELRDGCLNLLYVGRRDRRKGLTNLYRALPIAQKRLGRTIRLILVGDGMLGGRLIPKPLFLGGAKIVTIGRVSPEMLPRYYACADIYCSPAVGRESFGIVLLEAMASGVPVIASDIPGFRSIVSPGSEGFLVAPRSPERLADAILAVGTDAGLRSELGSRGRQKALQYHWPIVIDKLEGVLHRITGTRPESRRPAATYQSVG